MKKDIRQPMPNPDVIVERRDPVFQGYFQVDRWHLRHRIEGDTWSPPLVREVFERGHAVAVLPYDPVRGCVVVIEQFRMGPLAAGRNPWMIEIVAGIIEPEEIDNPHSVAQRECLEEIGAEVQDLFEVLTYLPSPGAVSETVTLYCGRIDSSLLPKVAGNADEGEYIRISTLTLPQLAEALEMGRFDNSLMLIAAQWLLLNQQKVQDRWTQSARAGA
jgi:ADP-ribose pyrophosphatase